MVQLQGRLGDFAGLGAVGFRLGLLSSPERHPLLLQCHVIAVSPCAVAVSHDCRRIQALERRYEALTGTTSSPPAISLNVVGKSEGFGAVALPSSRP
ncbi:hypothetical protein FKM82_005348 [Ascaphus truei]